MKKSLTINENVNKEMYLLSENNYMYYFNKIRIYYLNYIKSKNRFIENNKKLRIDVLDFIKKNDFQIQKMSDKQQTSTQQTYNKKTKLDIIDEDYEENNENEENKQNNEKQQSKTKSKPKPQPKTQQNFYKKFSVFVLYFELISSIT